MRKCTCVSSSARQERENTKEDILKNVRNKTAFFSYSGSQRFPKTARLQTFFRISSFAFRTNTFIQVWIYLRMMTDFHCWELCPFKVHLRNTDWRGVKTYAIFTFVISQTNIVEMCSNQIHCSKINTYHWKLISSVTIWLYPKIKQTSRTTDPRAAGSITRSGPSNKHAINICSPGDRVSDVQTPARSARVNRQIR